MIINTAVKKVLTTGLTLLLAIGFGAGLVFGVKACRDKEARDALMHDPLIAENTEALIAETKVGERRTGVYKTSKSDFQTSATLVLTDPRSTPQAKDAVNKGKKAITDADSVIISKDSTIKLLNNRAELLTEDAIRARRGKFLQVHAALGYAPYVSAPAARVGVDVNMSQRWGLTATTDVAMKFRLGNGNPKTEWLRTDFIGVKYRF